MFGIGIIHHHDSEFRSSQFQFNTILSEIPPLTKTIPIPTLTGFRVRIVL